MCINVCLIIFYFFNFWINSDSYKMSFNLKNLSHVFKFLTRDQKMNNFKKKIFPKSTRETRQKIFVLNELDDFDTKIIDVNVTNHQNLEHDQIKNKDVRFELTSNVLDLRRQLIRNATFYTCCFIKSDR